MFPFIRLRAWSGVSNGLRQPYRVANGQMVTSGALVVPSSSWRAGAGKVEWSNGDQWGVGYGGLAAAEEDPIQSNDEWVFQEVG